MITLLHHGYVWILCRMDYSRDKYRVQLQQLTLAAVTLTSNSLIPSLEDMDLKPWPFVMCGSGVPNLEHS